ncbi:MAG: DUF2807 domain-containing protein [Mucinivorans sp.]
MKKLILFTAIVAMLSSCLASSSKTITLKRFDGACITGVDVGSSFEVTLLQGPNTSATVEISEEYRDQLDFTLDNDGTVEVSLRGWSTARHGTVLRLTVVCSSIETIELSGASSATIEPSIASDKLDIDLSGASKLVINQPMTLSDKLDIDCSGASITNIYKLKANAVELDCSGASVVSIKGEADRIDIEASGASVINCEMLKTRTAICEVSGASLLSINTTTQASGTASGASKVSCFGPGQVAIKVSGSSLVSQ